MLLIQNTNNKSEMKVYNMEKKRLILNRIRYCYNIRAVAAGTVKFKCRERIIEISHAQHSSESYCDRKFSRYRSVIGLRDFNRQLKKYAQTAQSGATIFTQKFKFPFK